MKAENPTKIKKGKRERRLSRVQCGGDCYNPLYGVRASYRFNDAPTYRENSTGFRLVRNK